MNCFFEFSAFMKLLDIYIIVRHIHISLNLSILLEEILKRITATANEDPIVRVLISYFDLNILTQI